MEFEEQLEAADVYAAALYALAREQDAVDDVRAELDELDAQLERDERFARFMASDAIDDDARRGASSGCSAASSATRC
jgi:F0F1-type ATP synthase delta subunit